jgi:hypothetical protein
LEDTACGAGIEERLASGGLVGRGEPDNAHTRLAGEPILGGLRAVDAAHLPVHDDDIAGELVDAGQALLTGGGVPDDVDAA